MQTCRNFSAVQETISGLTALQELNLDFCSSLTSLPVRDTRRITLCPALQALGVMRHISLVCDASRHRGRQDSALKCAAVSFAGRHHGPQRTAAAIAVPRGLPQPGRAAGKNAAFHALAFRCVQYARGLDALAMHT